MLKRFYGRLYAHLKFWQILATLIVALFGIGGSLLTFYHWIHAENASTKPEQQQPTKFGTSEKVYPTVTIPGNRVKVIEPVEQRLPEPQSPGRGKWRVELRTASYPDGRKVEIDPGGGAAFLVPGPSFNEEDFIKWSGLPIWQPKELDLRQPPRAIIGEGSSKFAVRVEGYYRFGLRIQMPSARTTGGFEYSRGALGCPCWGNLVARVCRAKFSLNEELLIDDSVAQSLAGDGTVLTDHTLETVDHPVQLSSGVYDAFFEFGCFIPLKKDALVWSFLPDWNLPVTRIPDNKLMQTPYGEMTVLVARPGELGPTAARADDFVYPITTPDQARGK